MNKLVKRIVAAGMAVALVGGAFAGCSSSATNNDADTDTNSGKTYTVGVCQLVQHDALDAATQGFQDALKDKLGDAVTVDVQNASNDSATCATIVNGFVADGVDLIMANATPALQAAMSATTTIPIVATSVTDFATALEISDWTGTTGINVTGTSDLAPLEEQANMIKELCPDAKTVGILYCSAEPNSVYQAKEVAKTLADLGFETKEYTAADTNDIASVTQTACDNSDVIYIPTDNTMASSTGTIDPITSAANIPVITGEEGICKGCGLATLSISYYSIGYKAGEMAADILENGTDPSTMEIEYATDLTKKYVADRATALGITIPDTYEAIDMSEEE
jgi:putative ABC transport system substrate-binding protein